MSFVVRQRLREAQERQEAERERLSQQASVQAQQEQAQQSTLSVVATQDIKPSQNVASFARETGLPVSVVSKRADLLDQEQRRAQVFETLRRAPILSKVVANPNMAATLQESLDQLAEFEEKNSVRLSVRQAGNFFHDQAKSQMARMSVGSDPIRRARDEDLGLIERLEYEAVRLLIGEGAPRVLGAGQKAAAAASGVVQVPEMMTAIVGGLERGVRRPVGRALEETGIPGLQQVGQLIVSTTELQAPIFDALSEELTALRETLQPEEMDYLDKVAQGVGQFAAQLAVFVATGGLPAFAAAFAMGGGQQELRMREQGIDSSKHGLALLGGGAATAWTEITRFNRFMKILPPSARQRVSSAFAGSIGKAAQRNVTRIAGTVAREAAEEATQEAVENTLQNAVAKFTYEPDAEIFEGFVESLTVGGGVGAVVAAMLEVVLPGRLRDVETDTTKKSIEEMRDVVQAAVATTKHKQDVEEYINTATENETVGLDADGVNELFQDDPEGTRAMLEALGVSEAQIQRALEGDDILVAVSKLATMEDQGQFEQLVDIARTRPEAKTPREARRDAEEGLGPELTEQLNQILDENVALETDERIEQNVRDQLLRAGEARDVANAGGLIWSRVFRMLEMRGVDTAALYERLGLQVVGPGLEQPEAAPEAEPEPVAAVAPETTAKSQSLLDAFLDSATFNPLLDEAVATGSPEELRTIHRQLFGRDARGETAQEIADEISRRRIREVDVLDRDDEGRAELAARTLFDVTEARPAARPPVEPIAEPTAEELRPEAPAAQVRPGALPTAQQFLDAFLDSATFNQLADQLAASESPEAARSIYRQLFGRDPQGTTTASIADEIGRQRRREVDVLDRDAEGRAELAARTLFTDVEGTELEQVELRIDNPGGAWLESKRRQAAEYRDNPDYEGSYLKTVGPANVTAYTESNVEIDVNRLNALPGAQGEELTRGRGVKAERLRKSIEEKGYEPSPILVQVREDGQAFIVEGNNRVAEAVASNRGTIPARVEYLRGAENVAGDFAPDTLIARKAPEPTELEQAKRVGYEGQDTGEAREWIRARDKGLDMSPEARMQRARDMGFDTDTRLYHGTGDLRKFEKGFDPAFTGLGNDQFGSGFYLTTDAAEASAYTERQYAGMPKLGGDAAPGVIAAYVRINNPLVLDFDDARNLSDADLSLTEEQVYQIMKRNPEIMDMESSPIGDWIDIWSAGEITDSMVREVAKNYAGRGTLETIEGDLFGGNADAFRRAVNEVTGIDGVIVKFDGKEHRIAWFPEQIRSVNAAFDPDYADEPTLLAQEAVDTSVAGGLTEKSVITTRSLAGASIVPIFADLTSSGNVYSDLDGMAVTPTPYFGGPNFPYLKDYRDAGMVWAFNKKGPATKLINHVRRLRDKAIEEGRDPRVVVTVLAMKDDAHTSNETVINVLLRTLDAVVKTGQFPQDQLSAAKNLIVGKAGKKDEGYSGLATFPGFDDGAKLAAWTRNATFTTRKALANEMRSAKFRQLPGMFPINRIVREAIDPDYRATQQGDALVAFEIDPDADDIIIDFDQPEVRIPRHPAFRFGIKGRLVGSFGTHIPMDVLYSDLLAEVTERSKEGSNPKFLMERLRGTDRQIVTDEIVNLAEQIEQLDDYRAAKALVAGALGQWRSSDVDANKGGAAPAEFEQALVENEAAVTLTKYTRKDVFAGRRSGNLTVYQLGNEVVKNGGLNVWMGVKRDVDYRDEYPGEITQQLVDQGVITDKEVALVGVANNELGVRGMATFQVLKGIEEGVTILDAFKVRSPSKPDGLLPAIYATLGFEEVGEIPFDPQYYSDQEITALKAVWSRQGWTEGDGFPAVAIMKWRGDDALRSGATERFILESQAGLGIRGEPDVDQFDTTAASLLDGDVTRDEGDGRPRERDGRADPRSYADRARGLSGRARGFIANILAADERATDALKIDASDVQALRDTYGEVDLKQDQELEAPGERGPRGLTRVPGPLGTGTVLGSVPTLVKLTEAKDKTTFLHESAHVFLEVFAALEDTNPEIAAEMAPVREWLGWEKGKPLTVEMHEKFAGLDGFEGYLSTGKAPAPELRSVFEQFRNWFVKVYEKLRGREIKIDQRARDFFDRMLATEQEISNAERSYHDVLTDTMRGLMTPEQVEKHTKLAERAGRVARDRIFKKHLEQIMRRDRKTYKEAKRRIEEDVRAKLEDLPIFRALAELADEKSPVVLNRAVTEEIVGPDNMAPLEPYVSEEGVDPEGFALSMGFASADEMFQEIASNPDFDIAVEYETRRRLDDLEDDLLVNPDRAEQEAIEATFNDAQVRKLEVERDALAQRALQEPIPLQAIRRRARDVIDNTPIDEVIKPGRYAMQAQSLHKKAVKAAAKGQFDVALRLTHQAMMQHELARYAYKARSEIEKINRFLARFGRTRKLDPKRIAPEFIDPIRTLMAMPGAVDQTAARSVLVQFEALKAQENIMLELPVEIFTQENLPDRRKMTLQQFRSFRDGVKSLHKNGREQSDVEKAKRAARNQAMADVVIAAWGKRKLKEPTRAPKFMERLMSGLAYFDSLLIRLPFLAEILQNGRDGPLYDILWRDIAVAYNRTEGRHFRQIDQLTEILNKYNITARELNRLINEPLLDRNPIHKEKLFVILLNMGNAGNIQRISDDPSLPDALRGDPQAILQLLERRLEKRHFDAAQEIWDLLEQDRDDLGVVHQRRTGVIPTWVEPQELVTKYGTYKGGYYPIKYRPGVVSNSDIKEREVENLFAEFSGGGVSKAQTRNGMVQTRVESQQREMSWDFNNIISHMRDTAVMIEMSEAIDNAWSVISSSAFKRALEQTWGIQYQKPLENIIKRTAADATIYETEDSQPYNKIMRIARINASIAILGLRIPTALLAPVSYFQTVIPRYGFKVVARGWIEWFGRYNARFVKSKKTMEELSPFMAERARLINREATDIAKRQVFSGKWSAVQGSGYVPMAVAEKHTVGGPLWWGVYRTAKLKGLSDPQAIADADTAIATTQGGGRIMDQSIIQGASSEFHRALTFMWGFVSGYYGVVRTDLAGAETGLRKTAQLVKHFVVLNTFAAILENLIRDPTALFDEDDEEATFLFNVLKTMGRNMLIVPGASAVFSRYYNAPQLEQLSKDTQQTFNYGAKTLEDYFENGEVDGEMAWKTARRALETAGFALGVPGTLQAGQVIDVLEQLEEEDEDPSFETFYRALVAGPKDDS